MREPETTPATAPAPATVADGGFPGRSTRGWAVAYAVMLVVVPLASLVLMVRWPADELSPATVSSGLPATTVLQANEVTDSRRFPVELVWSDPSNAVAVGSAGGVSSILVVLDDEVVTGTPILTIDGMQVRGLGGDVAVTTAVGDGSPDPLQLAVSKLFVAAGVLDAPSDLWDAAMEQALDDYLELVGAPDSDRLDPGLLVWLPIEPFVVGEVAATVGAPFPPPGEPVLAGPPTLVSASPPAAEDGGASPGLATADNPYVASLDGVELGTWPLQDDPPAATLAALAEVVDPGTESVVVDVAIQEPVALVSAPSSAVLTGPDGTLCVVEPSGTTVVVQPVRSSGEVVEFPPVDGLSEVVTVASEVADSC